MIRNNVIDGPALAVAVKAPVSRAGPERLCRYGLRSPFAQERLALRDYPLSPAPTLASLAGHDLPRVRTARFHAPTGRSHPRALRSHDSLSMASPPTAPATESICPRRPRLRPHRPRWPRRRPVAELLYPGRQPLHRVFFVSALKCPRCSAAMIVLALFSDPPVIAKILRHLRLPTVPPPLAPARGSTADRVRPIPTSPRALRSISSPRHTRPADSHRTQPTRSSRPDRRHDLAPALRPPHHLPHWSHAAGGAGLCVPDGKWDGGDSGPGARRPGCARTRTPENRRPDGPRTAQPAQPGAPAPTRYWAAGARRG